MVKWEQLCLPKDQGDLGIMNSKNMNIALMCKWIWRLFSADENDNSIWLKIIRAKYDVQQLFSSSPQGGSQFWHSIHKI